MSKLNPKDSALVLIEFQNDFTTEKGKMFDAVKAVIKETKMLDNTIKLVAEMRKKGVRIVYVPITFSEGFNEISGNYGVLQAIKKGKTFIKGSWGADWYEPLKPQKDDITIEGKKGLCGFKSTNLDFVLRQNGIKNIILAGFLTNICVESTMRSAYERGYNVITLSDCTAATSMEEQNNAFKHNFGAFSTPKKSTEISDMIE